MTIFVQFSQKLWRSFSDQCQEKYQYLNPDYWLLLMQKTAPFEVVRDWMSQFPKFPAKSSEIDLENPLASFKNLNEDEGVSSLKTAKLMDRVASLPTKLKKWFAHINMIVRPGKKASPC